MTTDPKLHKSPEDKEIETLLAGVKAFAEALKRVGAWSKEHEALSETTVNPSSID